MPKGIKLQLHDENGDPIASLGGITVVWFDTPEPGDWRKVTGNNGSVSTDASGWLKLDLSGVSGLEIDDWGWLVAYKPDATDYRDSPCFAGRVQVSDVSGGTAVGPISTWVRNPAWLALPDVTGAQLFAGLHAVYPFGSNFVALVAEGNYRVDWGDGAGWVNKSSAAIAEKNLAWADYPAASDVGIAAAEDVTFSDSGDTVNLSAHGYQNGEMVAFSAITSTTGISTYTHYYVVGRAANTFQVSDTIGGSAKALTTDGSGKVYRPKYRQAIVKVEPNGGNLTRLSLNQKHSAYGLNKYSSGWIDCAVAGVSLAKIDVVGFISPITHGLLACFEIVGANVVTDMTFMFYGCSSLQSIPALNTAAVTSMNSMFYDCSSLQSIPALNTAAVTSMGSMFYGCSSLQSIPALNTAAVTSMGSMFYGCKVLQEIPALKTSGVTSFFNMFAGCASMRSTAHLSASGVTNTSGMFTNCGSLSAGRLNGTAVAISYSGCNLSGAALDDIYTGLASGVSSKTITVTNNWGTASHTPSIATAKGWTVTA